MKNSMHVECRDKMAKGIFRDIHNFKVDCEVRDDINKYWVKLIEKYRC